MQCHLIFSLSFTFRLILPFFFFSQKDSSDYVRKYFDVKKRAFLCNYMRDFGRFYAKLLFVNHHKNNRCEIRAFALKIMRVFPI